VSTVEIPFFSQRAAFARQWPRIEQLLDEAIEVGQFIAGPLTIRLEAALAEWTGARHVLAVASGTDALVLALEACGIGPGDEVLVPAYTFAATATAVAHVGARVLFVDIDPDSYAIDCDQLERVAARSPACRGVVPAHLFQHMADMRRLGEIAGRLDLQLIEDSAESIGTWQRGTHAGRFGRAGILSFFPSKTLGALGDAGAVITDDDRLAEGVAMRRAHGARLGGRPYEWELPGWNSRMDDVQASVLLARLELLEGEIARRRELAALYTQQLAPLAERVSTPRANPPHTQAAVYVYLIEADDRDALAEHLARSGVGTDVYYPRPLHRQPCFSEYVAERYPVAERAAERALALPLYPDLSDAQVERVCETIAAFYAARGRREGAA
jgi:UDP-2-acetamido-2-deoxy-ribo-hexuluronate aminotransferase